MFVIAPQKVFEGTTPIMPSKYPEGTEEVRQEKAADIAKTLTRMNEKGDLNDKQQAFIKRRTATLNRINNPFPRPSQPLY